MTDEGSCIDLLTITASEAKRSLFLLMLGLVVFTASVHTLGAAEITATCLPKCESLEHLAGSAAMDNIRQFGQDASERIPSTRDAAAKIAALNGYFFHDLGFRSDEGLEGEANLLPGPVIDNRRGYCVGLAVVYILLARQLDLPITAVATPSHIFVRYQTSGARINIELLNGGRNWDDAWYARIYKVSPYSIRNGVYLRNLNEKELLAYIYSNLGVLHSRVGDFLSSHQLYRAALRESSKIPVAHYNLGNDSLLVGRYKEAVREFTQALRLDPTDLWSMNNRGLALCRLGKKRKALIDFQSALTQDPAFADAEKNLADADCETDSEHR